MGGISTDAITNTDGRLLTPMHDLAQSTGLLCRQSAADTTISDTLTSQLIFVFHRPSIIYQPKHTKVRSILKGSLELRPLLFKPETFLVVFGYLCEGWGRRGNKQSCCWWLVLCPTLLVTLFSLLLCTRQSTDFSQQ